MKIVWTKDDFRDMSFNIYNLDKNVKVVDTFPQFYDNGDLNAEFHVELEGLDTDTVLRWIIFMYDKGSPISRKIDKLVEQKVEAADLAGIERTMSDTFPGRVMEFLAGENNIVNNMISRFLSFYHDEAYENALMYKKKLQEIKKDIEACRPSDTKTLTDLIKVQDMMYSNLKEIEQDIYHPQESRKVIQALYEQLTYKALDVTPEKRIEAIEQGKLVVPKPVYTDWEHEKVIRNQMKK